MIEAFKLCSHLKFDVFTISLFLLIQGLARQLLGLAVSVVLGRVGASLLLGVALVAL